MEPIEQREQSDACIDSAESGKRKAEGQPMEQREQSDACIVSAESGKRKALYLQSNVNIIKASKL